MLKNFENVWFFFLEAEGFFPFFLADLSFEFFTFSQTKHKRPKLNTILIFSVLVQGDNFSRSKLETSKQNTKTNHRAFVLWISCGLESAWFFLFFHFLFTTLGKNEKITIQRKKLKKDNKKTKNEIHNFFSSKKKTSPENNQRFWRFGKFSKFQKGREGRERGREGVACSVFGILVKKTKKLQNREDILPPPFLLRGLDVWRSFGRPQVENRIKCFLTTSEKSYLEDVFFFFFEISEILVLLI